MGSISKRIFIRTTMTLKQKQLLTRIIKEEISKILNEEAEYIDAEILDLIEKQCQLAEKYYLPIEYEKYTKDPEFQRIENILKTVGLINKNGKANEKHPLFKAAIKIINKYWKI